MKRKKAFSLRNSLRASWPGRIVYHVGMGAWNMARFRHIAFHHLLDKHAEGRGVSRREHDDWHGITACIGFGSTIGLIVTGTLTANPFMIAPVVYSGVLMIYNYGVASDGTWNLNGLLSRNSQGRQKLLERNKDAERKITL